MVRTENYEKYDFDLYPSGTNAVVAVISYTGYDMEDAMILNKSAYERGFGHGTVYKSYIKPLNDSSLPGKGRYRFLNPEKFREDRTIDLDEKKIEEDGLPPLGKKMEHGDVEFCSYDTTNKKPKYASFKDYETARMENIRILGEEKDGSR